MSKANSTRMNTDEHRFLHRFFNWVVGGVE